MHQQNDYGSQFYAHQHPPSHHNLNPNPISNPNEFAPPSSIQPSYASAPPYSPYSPSYMGTPNAAAPVSADSYHPYSQHADSIQTLPYSQPQHQSMDSSSQFPPYPNYTPSFFQPEPSSTPSLAQYSNAQQPSPAPYHPHDSHRNYIQSNPSPDAFPRSDLNPPPSSVYSPSFAPSFDHGGGFYGENSGQPSMITAGSFGQNQACFDQEYHEKIPGRDFQYGYASSQDGELGDGIYAYDGGRSEPYGARGTGLRSSSSSAVGGFDDYGRSTSFSSGRNEQAGNAGKIIRAVPKAETKQDVKSGAQKFRVKLLPEGTSVNTTDVLCQIGLDGIHMLDPSTNRTLRIYPLESVTRWEVLDSAIFCFWSKSPVDIEPKRIRLKSSSYTTSTILDTVTAASVQLKEMGGSNAGRSVGSIDSGKLSEQSNEKKKGFTDWVNKIKPANEEKDHWVPDEAVSQCTSCGIAFGPFVRRHHCRNCGDIFCDKCSQGRTALTTDENSQPVRVCDGCMAEVTQSLSLAKEAGNRSAAKQSHEDLARKLQEEMERNRKASSGSKSSDSSGKKMREVACPICTVHLQVQVPSSGSETIECGVCQHPFLVSAH